MKYFLLSLFNILILNSFACRCDGLNKLCKTDIDKAEYISLVRIKDILAIDSIQPGYLKERLFFKIVVEEISIYKGNSTTEIIISGGHPKFNTHTSCDLGIEANQEWLIFCAHDGERPIVFPCGRSFLYKYSNGFREWQSETGFAELNFLDSFFHKKVEPLKIKNGELRYYYDNKNVEKIEHYANGKLNGPVEYYYPDGNIYGRGFYKNNKLDQAFTWYHQNGAVSCSMKYIKGIKIDTSISYISFAHSNKIRSLGIFNKKGVLLKYQFYSGFENNRHLSEERFYNPKTHKTKNIYYHVNGKISGTSIYMDIFKLVESSRYDENGNLMWVRKYDKNGKLIK